MSRKSRNYLDLRFRRLKVGGLYRWDRQDVCIPREADVGYFWADLFWFDCGRWNRSCSLHMVYAEQVGRRLTKKEVREFRRLVKKRKRF